MHDKHLLKSFLYSVARIGLGLIVHPYQTMQSLVREKAFIWMTLLPTAVLGLVTVLWKYLFVPVVRTLFSCYSNHIFLCDWLPFISDWITFFCLYWQIMLLYLAYRFKWAFD